MKGRGVVNLHSPMVAFFGLADPAQSSIEGMKGAGDGGGDRATEINVTPSKLDIKQTGNCACMLGRALQA
jgi:hypothetical protein